VLKAARSTARRTAEAGGANTRAVPRQSLQAARSTSDELTGLYSNGPDDRSVKLALGYVTAATCGCGTLHCKAHGGGRRCQHEGCSKSAVGAQYCKAHGGGRRCQQEGCSKAAVQDGTDHCKTHGGGRRCQHLGCSKAAVAGGTPHCTAHGGGRRCQHEGCSKSVARVPGSTRCTLCMRRTQPQPDDAEAQ
jgi:hypothetical protein